MANTNAEAIGALQTIVGNSDDIAYPVVSMGTTAGSHTLAPNTFYLWGTISSSLTVTLGSPAYGVVNEYIFQFTLSGSASLLLPSSVSWNGGTAPTWESGKTYQISIVNNIAAYLSI